MVSQAAVKRVNKIIEKAQESIKEKPVKARRLITIDEDLNEELNKQEINVSDLCNKFLLYYLKKRDNNNKDKEETND